MKITLTANQRNILLFALANRWDVLAGYILESRSESHRIRHRARQQDVQDLLDILEDNRDADIVITDETEKEVK